MNESHGVTLQLAKFGVNGKVGTGQIGLLFAMGDTLPMANSSSKKPRATHFLRAWRNQRGKTLLEVAKVSGFSESYLSQVETGKRPRVNNDILEGYSKALDISRGALLEHAPLTGDVIDFSDNALIGGVWEDIPLEDRPQALRMLRSLSRPAEK